MNQKLLIVLPCCANDCVLAERSLDFIYRLHGKKQIGHLLIVANADLHQEMRTKLRVTAEMAFESVTETVAPVIDKNLGNSKFHQLNNLFRHAALTAQTNFRWPWFWIEPDCAITSPTWIAQLAEAYDAQPKKYVGVLSKAEKPFMARCGIYYPVASYELDKLCQGDAPFPLATSEKVVSSAGHTDLVQYLAIETPEDLAKISDKAVVVHGDKLGLFAENWETPPPIMPTKELEPLTWISHPTRQQVEKVVGMAIMDGSMHPQEIAKEINEFLEKPPAAKSYGVLDTSTDLAVGFEPKPPRLSRRQKRELMQKPKLDCVATSGCKSSTETVTP